MSDDATRRYIQDKGHNVILTAYAEGGTDAYEDATLIASPSTIKAIRKMYRGDFRRDPSGAIPVGDVVFWLPDEVLTWAGTVPTVATTVVNDGATLPASDITDGGVGYGVVMVDDQDNGMLAVLAKRKRPG